MAIIERPSTEIAVAGDATVGVKPSEALGVFKRPAASNSWRDWIVTVDHKKLGIMYGVAAFVFFIIGGVEALLIRLQLMGPDGKVLSADQYN
ncbi:MAG: cytochrome ubiquinol oxidase subunit I, partial [Actinobacteria bacterium]|nr:cytochrome ubiquinol oxidase subunit I [Actinomycetota bacterium]